MKEQHSREYKIGFSKGLIAGVFTTLSAVLIAIALL